MTSTADAPTARWSTRRAVWLSLAWLVVGLACGVPLLVVFGSDRAVGYWAVYVLERSLSLDNVFVFLLVLDYFSVPHRFRLRIVRWGIVSALALRAGAIAAGVQLIQRFSFVTYALGAVLLVLAVRMLRERQQPLDPERGRAVRLVQRVIPLTRDTTSGRFLVRSGSGWAVTPLGLTLLAFVVADLTFAVDSISAAFGITTDFVAIWLANALALVGLVPLLVLVRALVRRFRYMSQTFSAVLAFIGLRLLIEDLFTVGPLASLVAIAAILVAGVVASVVADRARPPAEQAREARRPPRCPPGHVRSEPRAAPARGESTGTAAGRPRPSRS